MKTKVVSIKAPNFQTAMFSIVGDAPYVQHRFAEKAKNTIRQKQESETSGKRKKPPRNFEEDYKGATYESEEGWHGIPVTNFRKGLISVCKLVGFPMTRAKLAIFIVADGIDPRDGCPLVKITKGQPTMDIRPGRNDDGKCDLRCRPMWAPGWRANLRIKYDADQFSLEDISNLLARLGIQGGVGEGRPDSPKSAGLGWGTFLIAETVEATGSVSKG